MSLCLRLVPLPRDAVAVGAAEVLVVAVAEDVAVVAGSAEACRWEAAAVSGAEECRWEAARA